MAKTLVQIETEIDGLIAGDSNLSPLASTSNTANFVIWKKAAAAVIFLVWQMVDLWKLALAQVGAAQVCGTLPWYIDLVNNWAITNSITGIKISARESDPLAWVPTVYIKVAKDNGSGGIVKLSVSELLNLKAYVQLKKVAGTYTIVISSLPDKVNLNLDIKEDGTNGSIAADVQTEVENYLNNLAPFVPFSKSLLQAHVISNVAGVIDCVVTNLDIDFGMGFITIANNLTGSGAGYFELNNLNSYIHV
jgi:hypothetical protein